MAGRGRGGFKPKFQNDLLTQLSNIQGPRSGSNNFEDAPEISAPVYANDSKYENLINAILKIQDDDDGILFNQKLQYITEIWHKICETEEAVEEALDVVHRRGLYDEGFASKLVNMMSSLSFNSLEIHNVKIRNQFIAKLQHDFDNCKTLQSKSPIAFRNAVRMLGEFYHKARFSSGKPIKLFAAPLKSYLEMLLESAQEEDLELFSTQLYMNGNGIRSTLPQNLSEIMTRVHVLLATNEKLTKTSKLWLLLAIDVSCYNFGLLPVDLQNFYVTNLGEKVLCQFERVNTELTIQTIHKNEFLDNIISNVTVLQVDNTGTTSQSNWDGNMSKVGGGDSYVAIDHSNSVIIKNQDTNTNFSKTGHEHHDGPKPSYGREKYLIKAQTYKKISPDNGANINNWDGASSNGTKRENNAPRPILGVGVRLQKSENKRQDDNWRERIGNTDPAAGGDWREPKSDLNPAAAGWEHKSKSSGGSGWGNDNNAKELSVKKSWSQHDDRTETDYTNS